MKNMDLPAEEAVIRMEMSEKPESVTVRRIDETHGNPLGIWEEMGSPETLSPAETVIIREQSAVHAEAWPYDWADGILTLRATLGVNDVYGFIIR